MKSKDIKELKNKSKEQLKKMVMDLEKDIAQNLIDNKHEQVKDVHFLTKKKKDIARLKTFMAQVPEERKAKDAK